MISMPEGVYTNRLSAWVIPGTFAFASTGLPLWTCHVGSTRNNRVNGAAPENGGMPQGKTKRTPAPHPLVGSRRAYAFLPWILLTLPRSLFLFCRSFFQVFLCPELDDFSDQVVRDRLAEREYQRALGSCVN